MCEAADELEAFVERGSSVQIVYEKDPSTNLRSPYHPKTRVRLHHGYRASGCCVAWEKNRWVCVCNAG